MQYYIQRHASGYVGNSLIWWRKGGRGYTCDIDQAEVFDGEDDHFKNVANEAAKFTAWEKNYIDSIVSKHVDSENIDYKQKGIKE
jgi:hypothetical protein